MQRGFSDEASNDPLTTARGAFKMFGDVKSARRLLDPEDAQESRWPGSLRRLWTQRP
jgi:hypothetical protein